MSELDGLPVHDRILPHTDRWRSGRAAKVRVLVIHTSEGQERVGSAVALARLLRTKPAADAAPAAYHWTVDPGQIVPCVAPSDTAWGAAGANPFAEHICICGRAGQDAAAWADADSVRSVDLAGRLLGVRAAQLGIPLSILTAGQLADGTSRGVVGHATVAKAFGKTTHWDPGPAFPWDRLLAVASGYAATSTPIPFGGDDMVLPARILSDGTECPLEVDAWYSLVRSDDGKRTGIAARKGAALKPQQWWTIEGSVAWLTFTPVAPAEGLKHSYFPGGAYRGVAIVAADGGVFYHDLA